MHRGRSSKDLLICAFRRILVRRLLVLVVVAALAGAPTPAAAAQACTDDVDVSVPFSVIVGGEEATGRYALPDQAPTGFVLFSHGYGHTSKSWDVHLRNAAAELGVIAVAMDYRGTLIQNPEAETPSSRGWQVAEGAADGIAATRHFETACPGMGTFTNFGVSMGGNTSGLIAAEPLKRADADRPLFDYWVNVEGATNVSETYNEASLLAPVNTYAANAKADIERQMGGTFTEKRDVYLERSVVTRADDIKASGVRRVVLVHGLDDGLVPYNQSREMAAALLAQRVRYDFYTVSRRDAQTEKDTTITGTVVNNIDKSYTSPFVGHASEKSTTHIIMRTALDALESLHKPDPNEDLGCWREAHVDGQSTDYRFAVPCPPGA